MSIDAYLEVENEGHLTLSDDFIGSKAIATFIEIICVYCESQDVYHELDDWQKEIYDWFLQVASKMTEDLCILNQVFYGFWEYNETEYDRYLLEKEKYDPSSDILSEEEFVNRCQEFDGKWIVTENLKSIIDNLVSALKTVKPSESWFYTEKDTLVDFQSLSDALLRASEKGYRKVRIYFQ